MTRNLMMIAAGLTLMVGSGVARAAGRIPTSTDGARALAARSTPGQTSVVANQAFIVTSSDQARALAARSSAVPVAVASTEPFIFSSTDEARGLSAPLAKVASAQPAEAAWACSKCPCHHHG